jgi:hypothetical protein
MTARPAWARAYRRCGLKPGNTSFLVMNPDVHFVHAMGVIVCTVGVGKDLRTSVCTSSTVLEAEVMVALSSKLFKKH